MVLSFTDISIKGTALRTVPANTEVFLCSLIMTVQEKLIFA